MQLDNKKFNRRIKSLWTNELKARPNLRAPMLVPENLKRGAIVFVGLNPSFSARQIQQFGDRAASTHPKEKWEENLNIENLFMWTKCMKKKQILQIQAIDNLAYQEHPYFIKPRKIAEQADADAAFVHLDIFRHRETSQSQTLDDLCITINRRASGDHDVKIGSDFAEAQLQIFYSVLKECAPRAIVVINAAASKIVKSKIRNATCSYEEDADAGLDRVRFSGSKKSIPILYSGMLSGRRALDLDSVDRLSWHLKFALGKLKTPTNKRPA